MDRNPPAKAAEQVQFPIQEDPTCHRAAKPVSNNYWARALELQGHNNRARALQLLKFVHLACAQQQEKPLQWGACVHTAAREQSPLATTRNACHSSERPSATRNNKGAFCWKILPDWYADDIMLMAEHEGELKSLLMKVKEESKKTGLNQHSKN